MSDLGRANDESDGGSEELYTTKGLSFKLSDYQGLSRPHLSTVYDHIGDVQNRIYEEQESPQLQVMPTEPRRKRPTRQCANRPIPAAKQHCKTDVVCLDSDSDSDLCLAQDHVADSDGKDTTPKKHLLAASLMEQRLRLLCPVSPTTDDIIVGTTDVEEESPDFDTIMDRVVPVKVCCQGRIRRFVIPSHSLVSQLQGLLANELNTSPCSVSLYKDGNPLCPEQTLAECGVTLADIIECFLLKDTGLASSISTGDQISVKVQASKKDVWTFKFNKHDKFRIWMEQYCLEKRVEQSCAQFLFDGDRLHPEQTLDSIDMDDGEQMCVDFHGKPA